MENYLYFAEADVETGADGASEAITIPASSYLFADPISSAATAFFFKSILGNDYGMTKVSLVHDNNKNKEVIRGVLACINANKSKGGFVIVANANTAALTTGAEYNEVFNGVVSGVAVIEDVTGGAQTNITGTAAGTSLFSSYGAGALSTEIAPQYRRKVVGENITTDILVDLTGLGCKGTAANDVIGLPAGGAAYIGKYVSAKTGTIHSVEVICVEAPTQASGTFTTDIDVNFNANAALAYDGAAGTSEINTGGFATVGGTGMLGLTAAAANDYIYLVEGDTAATDGVYSAGKLIVRLHGTTTTF